MPVKKVKKEITRSKFEEVKKILPEVNPFTDRVGKIETVKCLPNNKASEEPIEYDEYQFQLLDTFKHGLTYIFLGTIIDDESSLNFTSTLTDDGLSEACSHLYHSGYAEKIFLILGNESLREFLNNIVRQYDLLHSFNLDGVEEEKERLVKNCENYSSRNLVFTARHLGIYCYFDFMKPINFVEIVGFSSSGEKLVLKGNK